MTFRQLVIFGGFVSGMWFLMSNAGGVPQAVTKAPGESQHNSCATCHISPGNYVPSIALDVLNTDSVKVASYIPGQTYIVRVRVSATNNPKAYGFQMACLDSLTNTDKGLWSSFGDKVKQQTLTVQQKPRKYLVQSSPKTNGIFTANWKAPATDAGKIKFYFTGLAINQNGGETGDNNIFSQLTINSPSTSAVTNIDPDNKILMFPNPGSSVISVSATTAVSAVCFNEAGIPVHLNVVDGTIDISALQPGLYFTLFKNKYGAAIGSSKLIKN